MTHKQPINDLSLKPNMDEKEQRHRPPRQETVRNTQEEAVNEL